MTLGKLKKKKKRSTDVGRATKNWTTVSTFYEKNKFMIFLFSTL